MVIQWYKKGCFSLREEHPLAFKNKIYVNYIKKDVYMMYFILKKHNYCMIL